MEIRLATTTDVSDILKIYAWYVRHTAISFELKIPELTDFTHRFEKYSAEAPWLVALSKKQIIGFAYASPHRGRSAYAYNREVSIYLTKDFHGKNVGKKLYSTLLALLKLQGYTNALAGIVVPNQKSTNFHKKMGFQLIGTYQKVGYKFDKWWNVAWYECFLQKKEYRPIEILTIEKLFQHIDYEYIMNKN